MTQEVEIELKNLLTEAEFKHLHTMLESHDAPASQTNYYFETQDMALKANGAALRIRQKHNHYTLTLKEPHPDGLLETHDALTPVEAKQWLNNEGSTMPQTGQQLTAMGIDPQSLTFFGSLTTKRWEMPYKGVQVVLDQSFYQDKEDFELEVEGPTTQLVDTVFRELLTKASIPVRNTPNKIKRLFDELIRNP